MNSRLAKLRDIIAARTSFLFLSPSPVHERLVESKNGFHISVLEEEIMCILLLLLLYRMQLPLYLIFPVFPRDRRLEVRIFDDDDEDVRLGIFQLQGRDRESEAHRVTSGPYIYTPWLLLLVLLLSVRSA